MRAPTASREEHSLLGMEWGPSVFYTSHNNWSGSVGLFYNKNVHLSGFRSTFSIESHTYCIIFSFFPMDEGPTFTQLFVCVSPSPAIGAALHIHIYLLVSLTWR